jgi:hypothetical protein
MTLKPTQTSSGTSWKRDANPVNKTGRPDHPTLIDGTPEAGKVGTVSTYVARGTSGNPVAKSGRPDGMGPSAGIAGPGMSPSNVITTHNSANFIQGSGHSVPTANQMGTPRLSEFTPSQPSTAPISMTQVGNKTNGSRS